MKKINFKTRKELIKLFKSKDLEIVLLGISLIRTLEYYNEIKDNITYNSIGGYRTLEELLYFIEYCIKSEYNYESLISVLIQWLQTQKVIE